MRLPLVGLVRFGMEVLRRVKDAYPDTLVIVMTGYASVSSAVEVMKIGALD